MRLSRWGRAYISDEGKSPMFQKHAVNLELTKEGAGASDKVGRGSATRVAARIVECRLLWGGDIRPGGQNEPSASFSIVTKERDGGKAELLKKKNDVSIFYELAGLNIIWNQGGRRHPEAPVEKEGGDNAKGQTKNCSKWDSSACAYGSSP